MKEQNRTTLIQFFKYACVGVINTMVTLILIFICKSLLGVNEYVSNAIGYVGGVINSFIWNKKWVFHSEKRAHTEALKFTVGFLVCYSIQLFVVWFISEQTPYGKMEWEIMKFTIGGYGVATLIGTVVYTVVNFIYNRLVTFK